MTRSSGLLRSLFGLLVLVGCADPDSDDSCVDETSCGAEQPPQELALLPPAPAFFVNVDTVVSQGGTVSASSNSFRARCSGAGCTVLAGAQVVLSAVALPGFSFVRWSGCSSSSSARLIINPRTSTTCTATFAPTQFTVTAVAGSLGTVYSSVRGVVCTNAVCRVNQGDSVSLVAVPAQGAAFASWSGCTGVVSGTQLTLAAVNTDLTCTANFQR